jgi:hypothetical protein
MPLTLTADDRRELEHRARGRKSCAEDVRRAEVILLLAEGTSFATVTATVGCPRPTSRT